VKKLVLRCGGHIKGKLRESEELNGKMEPDDGNGQDGKEGVKLNFWKSGQRGKGVKKKGQNGGNSQEICKEKKKKIFLGIQKELFWQKCRKVLLTTTNRQTWATKRAGL
jgi:hypothetical protein